MISFIEKGNDKITGFIYPVGLLSEYQDKGFETKLLEFVKDYIKSHVF